ncbi:MAG: hypothetical protein J2P26_09070, partial [Nocardiopsaceae bacterium]|nr:hypothetical protein [Nocardiopsaceae bacterium]
DTAKGGEHDVRLAFHLGPDVTASLSGPAESLPGSASSRPGAAASLSGPAVSRSGPAAELAWPGGSARLDLPAGLSWTLHRGETEPPLGWYSEGLGRKVPATVLIGAGRCLSGVPLVTRLRFFDPEPRAETR